MEATRSNNGATQGKRNRQHRTTKSNERMMNKNKDAWMNERKHDYEMELPAGRCWLEKHVGLFLARISGSDGSSRIEYHINTSHTDQKAITNTKSSSPNVTAYKKQQKKKVSTVQLNLVINQKKMERTQKRISQLQQEQQHRLWITRWCT